jgi:thiamine-phosphate pyrophosphorylase
MDNVSQNSFFRIVDAAANRASEGLRVAEDVVRMHLDDRFLASQLKNLRHDLAEQVGPLSRIASVARDSIGDVGRTIETASEYRRAESTGGDNAASFESLLVANFKRAQQAIRTLEEFSKTQPDLVSVDTTKSIEQIRYRSYTLEKACRIALRCSSEFPNPSIYVLVEGCDWSEHRDADDLANIAGFDGLASSRFAKTVVALVEAKVDFLQLRDKTLSDRQLVAAGQMIARLVEGSSTRFVMNDRADLAVACGADGVHVGQDELTVAAVRKIVGPAKIVGVSTHSLPQAKQAVVDGADYIGVGPVFPSTTKTFSDFVGLELVNEVCGEIGLPAFAIGGIDLSNAQQVAQAGCQRVAVTAAFSSEPIERYAEVASQLRRLLNVD